MPTVTLTDDNHGLMQVHDGQESLYQYKEAFPQTYKLFCAAVTFVASSAKCENSFSTLTRFLTPARRSMLQSRMSSLVMLSFEKELTRSPKEVPCQ